MSHLFLFPLFYEVQDLRAFIKSILTMFSCKSFIVPAFTFRSLIHFEFIFVYCVRECSDFILVHVAVQFS